jgi:CubicO group peptidase (beta-lactamase class C family)
MTIAPGDRGEQSGSAGAPISLHNFFKICWQHGRMRWNVPMLFLLVVSAGGQQNIPGALAQDYIASFNGGEEPMRKFFQRYGAENVPLEARIARFRELKADMGSLKVRKIEVTTPDAIRLDAESASGEPVTLVLHLSGGAAAKLGSVEVRRGPPDHDDETPGPPLQARAEPDALRDIEALVKSTAASDKFSGAVLVARGESILWEGAYGYAHKETKSSNTTATKFNIGSIGKSFTSTAVAQLAAQGKLGLDDTIGKYLPDYPNRTAAEKVTIRHLLAMQSGIGDFFGPRYRTTPKNELRSPADYLKLFADQPLAFEPGQGRQYSNGGFVVLGLIIEKASGMSYYDYVQKHIFDVAGMRDTGLFEQDDPIENRATGYTLNFGAPRRANVYTLTHCRNAPARPAVRTPRCATCWPTPEPWRLESWPVRRPYAPMTGLLGLWALQAALPVSMPRLIPAFTAAIH